MDFIRRWRPDLEDAALVRASRLATIVVALLAVAWAPQIERFGSLWQYVQGLLAYVVPPVTALYLVGLFWPRANSRGAMACLLSGLFCGVILFIVNPVLHLIHLHFLYVAPILFVQSVSVLVLVSLATDPDPPEKSRGLTWSPAFFRAETKQLAALPVLLNYRVLGAVLIGLTAALVYAFR
jgi:SSS family solute:Na+ symporter